MSTKSKKPAILVDVDGTIFDTFRRDDHKIIKDIFGSNILIQIIDKFLWFVNGFDIISNSMAILKLRLFVYSLLGGQSYKYVVKRYAELYASYLNNCIYEINYYYLSKLIKYYEIYIITNNPFSVGTMKRYFDHVYFSKHTMHRRKNIERLCKRIGSVKYFIGNNYQDDIKLAREINVRPIYIGKSKLVKLLGPYRNFRSFEEAIWYVVKARN